jgi:diguanylate cyclase (GGDEF)-like protein
MTTRESSPSTAGDRTLAQQLSRAFTVFGALVAVGFVITGITYVLSKTYFSPEAAHTRLAVRAESAANAAMIDEENGLRGYLMTRDPRFLEAYARGQSGLARANLTLDASTNVDSELAAPMLSKRMAEERWTERWAVAAADTRPDVVGPSMIEGKALFDAYRSDEARFAGALDERNEALLLREQRVTSAGITLVLGVFLAVFLLAVRQHNALRDSIVGPVASLLRHIGRVRDGELEATVRPSGARDLRQLGEGLNDMVRALAAAQGAAVSRDEMLRNHSVRLRQILEASREFSESLNLAYVVGSVIASTATVGGYERVLVWLMDDGEKQLVNAGESSATADATVEVGHGLAGRAAKAGRTAFEGPTGQPRFIDDLAPIRAIAIPLIVGARVVGVLEARHPEARRVTTQSVEVLEMLATHAATAIESARLHELTEERSQIDALTRLSNRRRLDADLDAECKRCVRYGRPLAFVMLDVDNFKAFNDAHGHPAADVTLQELADVLAGCVRTTDTAYRYGGEEFCVLLRETSGADAMTLAERIRQRIEARFASGPSAGVTASLGVAEFVAAFPMPRSLVEAADAALYESKHGGRNRVMLSLGPPAMPALRGAESAPPS